MGHTDDSSTSMTLLRTVCGPGANDRAWQVFCDRYQPLIYRWCVGRGLQDADAEDVSQKVLQAMFLKINTFDPARTGSGGFRGWLKTVVHHAVDDFRRSCRRHPGDRGSGDTDRQKALEALVSPESILSVAGTLDSTLRRDLDAVMARVEKSVDPATMSAYRLAVLEGRPIADVAAQLGKSYAAVCMAIQRVNKKLRAEGAKLLEQLENAREAPP